MAFAPTKVPKFISPEIKRACSKVAGSVNVEFIKIETRGEYLPNKCALNAKKEVEIFGGKVVFGWAIYVWQNVMLDFIGHAVVQRDRSIYCVTPSKYGETKIAFVPDSSI